jgi:hypothetical protein
MSPCIGEPVSWMRLERYGLGELPAAELATIREHLAACPACGECFARIELGRELPALPPLAAGSPRARPRAEWWGWLAVASAAAVALLLVARTQPDVALPGSHLRAPAKGGDFAIELVRIDAQNQLRDATHFTPSDRFKVLLTCPAPWLGHADLVVYQDGRAFFPLAPQLIESCGNRRALAGAFQLDGASPASVCVALARSVIDRNRLAQGAQALPELSLCTRLEPTPSQR